MNDAIAASRKGSFIVDDDQAKPPLETVPTRTRLTRAVIGLLMGGVVGAVGGALVTDLLAAHS